VLTVNAYQHCSTTKSRSVIIRLWMSLHSSIYCRYLQVTGANVKPFNLAALKFGDFTCKNFFGALYFGDFKPHQKCTEL